MNISRRNIFTSVCNATRHMDKISAKMDKSVYPESMWQACRLKKSVAYGSKSDENISSSMLQ